METQKLAPAIVPSDRIDESTRLWSSIAHLSSFTGFFVGVGFILGPLLVWLMKREDSTFVDGHGKEAFNFNLSMLLWSLIGVGITIFTLGLGALVVVPMLLFFAVAHIYCTIKAAILANRGETYQYPFTFRLVG